MSFIYMKKEDFDYLVERSLELAEFHGDDIRDAAKLARPVPEWATHFAKGKSVLWQCTGADGETLEVSRHEEIKK